MSTHIHHIIPRHLGGTDNPSNIMEVTVKVHAQIHQIRWLAFGHWQDKVAWMALSGQINMDEASRLAQLEGCKKGGSKKKGPPSETHRKNLSLANKGQKHSEEQDMLQSIRLKGNKIHLGFTQSEETRKKISEKTKLGMVGKVVGVQLGTKRGPYKKRKV